MSNNVYNVTISDIRNLVERGVYRSVAAHDYNGKQCLTCSRKFVERDFCIAVGRHQLCLTCVNSALTGGHAAPHNPPATTDNSTNQPTVAPVHRSWHVDGRNPMMSRIMQDSSYREEEPVMQQQFKDHDQRNETVNEDIQN